MILFIADRYRCSEAYRLRNYRNFIDELSKREKVKVHYVDQKEPKHTLKQVIAETGKPDVIFLFHPYLLPSDFTGYKTVTLTTDIPSMNSPYHHAIWSHKVKFHCVFVAYLPEWEYLGNFFDTKRYVHFGDWTCDDFDYEKYQCEKPIDFFISGDSSCEYPQRMLYTRSLEGAGFNHQCNLSGTPIHFTAEQSFINMQMSAKFNPHDGGIKQRLVNRYYEASLAKALVVSPDMGKEAEWAGFKDGENIIYTSRGDMTQRDWQKILDNPKREVMAQRAYELCKERHTTSARVSTFLENL